MIDTYNYFRKFTYEKYISMENKDLVELYLHTNNEFEKSQSFGAIYIKNFPAIVKIAGKYNDIDSSEKAGMVTEELLKCLVEYDSTKSEFITYLINRISNMFLWNYTNNKSRIDKERESISLSQDEESEYEIQIPDKSCDVSVRSAELRMDIEKAFESEINKYTAGTKEYEKNKERVLFNKKVFELLMEDPSQCADQLARRMGLFRPKEEYYECRLHPDYDIIEELDESGKKVKRVVTNTLVRTSQYEKIQRAIKELRQLFVTQGVYCPR